MDNSVGKRIETLRKSKKISQEDLAEKVGVSRMTVYKWESGTSVPNYANMQALARALETTVSFFTDETSFECDEEERERESARENEIALSVENELCAADITYENPAEEAYCDKPKLQRNSGDNDGKKGGRAIFLVAAILSLIGCVIFSAFSVFIFIIVFSDNNKGYFYANTSGTSIDHFILSVIAAVLCLSASVTCFVVHSKKLKNKNNKTNNLEG